MPMYLKRDTIRLLESSVEAISLAVTSLGLPQRHEFREEVAQNSIAIGLTGVAAELAMSSIIVQAKGENALRQTSGFYKTGGIIVDDFKDLINSKIPKLLFLTQNVEKPLEHINAILLASSKFKMLTKSRAGGLHAGIGPSRDVCVACINEVLSFLRLLGKSSRIKPYTETVPQTIVIQKSYELIVEDLINKVNSATSTEDKVSALASIFLVIPELPENEPDWLAAFDRVMVSPKDSDIAFLLDTLKQSKYASLVKVSPSNNSIPVSVQKGVPGALPMEPQYLKKSFSNIRDRCYADRGTANGRLDQGLFDPPPIESVYEIFSLGLHTLQIVDKPEDKLLAVDSWPLIASSLSYQGTLGPYWYFVRNTSDWGQLDAYMLKASKVAGKKFEKGYKEFKSRFEVLKAGKSIGSKDKVISALLEYHDKASEKRAQLLELAIKYKGKDKELCEQAYLDLSRVVEEKMNVGQFLINVVNNIYVFANENSKKYWTRTFCEAASEIEDCTGLLAVLKDSSLELAYTPSRKALRVIDFIYYGPTIT